MNKKIIPMSKPKNLTWRNINWKECEKHVKKLQEAIFKKAKTNVNRYKHSRVAV